MNEGQEHLYSRKRYAGLGGAIGIFGRTGLTVHEMDLV